LTTSTLHRVERSETAGIPTFRVETPGPAFAMLMFRVGRADEPLTHAGITHLVEHLAFHRLRHLSYEHNGTTEPTITRFFAEGEPDEVAEFVRTVASSLVDPPLERIGREARVLREEAADQNTDAADLLRRSRYGASPHGRPAYPEYGLWWLDSAAVGAWIRERFTRDNAALVLAGPVSDDLDLDVLPRGERFPLPEVRLLDAPTPRHHHGPDGIVMGTMLTERGVPSMLAEVVLDREIEELLRHEHGLVYDTIADALPLDLTTKEVLVGGVVKDRAPAEQVATMLVELLTNLGRRGPDHALLESARRRLLRQYREPLAGVSSAVSEAEYELTGFPSEPIEQEVAAVEAASPAAVAEVIASAAPTLVLTVPEEIDLNKEVYGACEPTPEDDRPVEGIAFRESRLGRRRAQLVVGAGAVGLRFADGSWWRLSYDEVEAAVWYDDGSRELMTRDGRLFPLEPSDWRRGDDAVAAVDAALPHEVFVPVSMEGVPEGRLPRLPHSASPVLPGT
jgi:zinc protease